MSSVAVKVSVSEVVVVIFPPFCTIVPLLLSTASVMAVSGGVVSGGDCCWTGRFGSILLAAIGGGCCTCRFGSIGCCTCRFGSILLAVINF